ncbi:unnamed protein product [Porites evermanni]|uniref:UspA domain-containing protein n=1 Tax=Porites evermanni TaxID=104178 RepID=A0ABN8QW75_9CNID|nr:unnamed protein product [Porites evermanni]
MSNIYHEGDKLVIIHSHELHPPVMPHMILTDEWTREVAKHEKTINELERRYEEKCKALKLSAKIIVTDGPPGEIICKQAKEQGASFIVVGSRGTGTIRRTILGSVSDYVLHHAHMPVVVVPKSYRMDYVRVHYRVEFQCGQLEKAESMAAAESRVVVIAVDASDHAEKAFNWYKDQVYRKGDKLVVVHSHELHPPALPHAMATEEWKKEVQKHEQYIKDLEEKYKAKCEAMEVSAKIIIQGGNPGEHVCKIAEKEHATLIVCGSRGMGTVRRTILGSTSDYIIHHAHCPCLVVPKDKHSK